MSLHEYVYMNMSACRGKQRSLDALEVKLQPTHGMYWKSNPDPPKATEPSLQPCLSLLTMSRNVKYDQKTGTSI